MADVAIQTGGAEPAPLGYQIPGAQEIVLKAITASFDGSGAGSAFVPTLQIIAPNGLIVASCPIASSVAAGASADVSWFPRGGVSQGGSGGSGIQYDTFPQAGDWLYSETTDATGSPHGYSTEIIDSSPSGFSGVRIAAIGATPAEIVVGNAGVFSGGHSIAIIDHEGSSDPAILIDSDAGGAIGIGSQLQQGNEIDIGNAQVGGTSSVKIVGASNNGFVLIAPGSNGLTVTTQGQIQIGTADDMLLFSNRLSFFAVPAVAQQPTPVTLADVIALLQAYGLAA